MDDRQNITDINSYRKRRRRAGSFHWLLIFVFLLGCSFAGYLFAISNFFSVAAVNIHNNSQVDDSRLIELSGIKRGDSVFAVNLKQVEQWMHIEPRIKSAVAKRGLPDEINITVEERLPVAAVHLGRSVVEIDIEGRVLTRYTVVTELNLPLLSGVEYPEGGMMPGGFLEGENLRVALQIISALPDDAQDIGEIDVQNPQNIRLYTVPGIEIRLGDSSDFPEKYVVYSNIILDNVTQGGKPIRYIDVSTSKPAISTY